MTDPARDQRLRRAFLAPRRPVIEGLALRPFSLWTLDFCDELGLGFFLDPKKQSVAPPVDLTESEQLAALVWGHLDEISSEEVDGHLFSGTWPQEVRRIYRAGRVGPATPAIWNYIAYIAELIGAATVKIRPRKVKGEKRAKDPADLLHPAGRTALIWAVSGGQVQSEEQHRYLYREMSLPILLQYYHAACREAQLLTVPAGRKTDPAKLEAAKSQVLAAAKKTAPPEDYF
jgi:hypothetical protein